MPGKCKKSNEVPQKKWRDIGLSGLFTRNLWIKYPLGAFFLIVELPLIS
jgi:hypothetical protein